MTICKNLWKLGLLIHNGQKIHRLLGDQVQGDLEISHFQISGQDPLRHLIIDEADLLPVDALLVVLLLLHLEYVLHEELLKILVGVVDAKLLERVGAKVLEAEDVEHADGGLVPTGDVRLGDGRVDLPDDVDEEAPVDPLREGISHVLRLVVVQRGDLEKKV